MAIFSVSLVKLSCSFFKYTVIFLICVVTGSVLPEQVSRPRGVSLTNKPFYENKVTFTCLDGSLKIPFSQVNDDYCDCRDGTDEPGTAACTNGQFHCTNAGHKPLYLPSSRVNDGICDCCDTTDEYDGKVSCENNCKELGKVAREQKIEEMQAFNQGYRIRQDYVRDGKETKEEKQKRLDELREEKRQVEAIREEKRAAKEEAEVPEKEAKDKHKESWEKIKEQIKEEKQREEASLAFNELDVNNDKLVSTDELQSHLEFDADNNGEVSHEEAVEILIDDEVSLDLFAKEVWSGIKDKYKPTQQVDVPPPPIDIDVEDVEGGDINPDDYPDDEDYPDSYIDEEDEDEEDYAPPRGAHRHKKDDDDDEMPEYDEETKVLIEIADKAREEFGVEDSKYNKINREITDLEKVLALDLGADSEFYFLEGKCFDYQDKEYTYKFCPFEKVSQKKSGKETSLGKWKGWEGPEGNKYSKMKYDGGERCWNGPDRSTLVNLRCGIDNIVTTAFEPNRCEYEMDFKTPVLCNQLIDADTLIDKHDEL